MQRAIKANARLLPLRRPAMIQLSREGPAARTSVRPLQLRASDAPASSASSPNRAAK
jgi:hypothetical protein